MVLRCITYTIHFWDTVVLPCAACRRLRKVYDIIQGHRAHRWSTWTLGNQFRGFHRHSQDRELVAEVVFLAHLEVLVDESFYLTGTTVPVDPLLFRKGTRK